MFVEGLFRTSIKNYIIMEMWFNTVVISYKDFVIAG